MPHDSRRNDDITNAFLEAAPLISDQINEVAVRNPNFFVGATDLPQQIGYTYPQYHKDDYVNIVREHAREHERALQYRITDIQSNEQFNRVAEEMTRGLERYYNSPQIIQIDYSLFNQSVEHEWKIEENKTTCELCGKEEHMYSTVRVKVGNIYRTWCRACNKSVGK